MLPHVSTAAGTSASNFPPDASFSYVITCLALGGIEFETHVGKACGPGSGEHLHSREAQRKRKPQMRQRQSSQGNGCALPRKRFSGISLLDMTSATLWSQMRPE